MDLLQLFNRLLIAIAVKQFDTQSPVSPPKNSTWTHLSSLMSTEGFNTTVHPAAMAPPDPRKQRS